MVYGYIRVSTDKQTVENQRFEILNFCKKKKVNIDKWIEETISGVKNYNKRKLGETINIIKQGDVLICSEISRLGRSLFMIMEILNICMNKGCKVLTIKDNFCLEDDIQSKVLAFAFGLSAEIERKLISQRTREALARIKNEGKKLGRPIGSQNKSLNRKCVKNHNFIVNQYYIGISIPNIAKQINVSKGTLYKYLRQTKIRSF